MDKYLRTHFGVLLAAAVISAFVTLPTSAQVRNTASNHGQAALHIRINIVPALIAAPPPPEPRKSLNGPISYDVPVSTSNAEMTEEIHSVSAIGKSGVVERVIVKTLTVVPR